MFYKNKLTNAVLWYWPCRFVLQLAFENIPGSVVSYVFPEFTMEDLDDTLRLKQCFPLYSVLSAAGLTSLDFLSLDVEGIDHLVLKSLPWKKVNIKVIDNDVLIIKRDAKFTVAHNKTLSVTCWYKHSQITKLRWYPSNSTPCELYHYWLSVICFVLFLLIFEGLYTS